jgi:hypothetical protein
MFGLSIGLFHQIQVAIESLFLTDITITETTAKRAIYFHAYLLEQTEQVLNVTDLDKLDQSPIDLKGDSLQKHLMRRILLLPSIIVLKSSLYTIEGIYFPFHSRCSFLSNQ